MPSTIDSRVPVATETRKLLAAQKRGGETYDNLLHKMIEQYNPEEALEAPPRENA